MVWHAQQPVGEDERAAGAALAFGRPLELLPRLDRAAVVLCLDADPLGPGPDQIRHARGFAAQRQARAGRDAASSGSMRWSRRMSLTGAKADHRRAVRPAELHDIVAWLAAELGAPLSRPALRRGAQHSSSAVAGRPAGASRRGAGAGRRGAGARAARPGALDQRAPRRPGRGGRAGLAARAAGPGAAGRAGRGDARRTRPRRCSILGAQPRL